MPRRTAVLSSARSASAALAAVVLALGAPVAVAQTAPATGPATREDSPRLDYVEKTLANGLRVVVLQDDNAPVVAVRVAYHVGSKDEDPKRQGFAHMFEHMMFRGTDRLGPKAHFELIRGVGGDNNAHTSFDDTVYEDNLPSNQLDLALWLEAERMAFLKIDENSFYTERAVVEEERRLGLNKPYGSVFEKVLNQVFTKHPYRWAPIGQIPHLRKATIDELARFWETYYVPNNATLVIVGAVDPQETLKTAEQYFSWIPRGAEPPRVTETEPAQSAARTFKIEESKGPVTIIGLGYRTAPIASPDTVPLDVLLQVLGGGESSRIYQELVKEKGIAVVAGAEGYSLEQDGLAAAFAVLPPLGGGEAKQKQATESLMAQIDRVKTEPVTPAELDKAKTILLKQAVDQATTVAQKADLIGTYATVYKKLGRVNDRFDEIRRVTADDLMRVANKFFVDKQLNTVIIEPSTAGMLKNLLTSNDSEGAAPATKPTSNRVAERRGPKSKAVRPSDFPTTAPVEPLDASIPQPNYTEQTLPNGLKVVVIPNHQLPLVTMVLGLKYGAWTESPDHLGAANMAASTVTQGTENYTSLQLADALEKNAIGLSASVSQDAGSVSVNSLTDKLDTAAKLMAEVVRRPTFPADEIEQARTQLLSSLRIADESPDALASEELARQVWAGHPYGRRVTGEVADVKKLRPADLKQWWATYVRPDTTVLYIAGDVTPESGVALARKYLGDWTADTKAPSPELPAKPAEQTTKIYLIDKPGSVQSQIRVGQLGVDRTSPDYAAARVFTQIFGGSFNSRLNDALRVKKGLTYGASGYFSAQRFGGSFTVTTFTKTPTTGETVQGILDVVSEMKSQPVTDAELKDSRNYLVGSFAGDRERPEAIIRDLWLIEYTGLPKDYLQQNLMQIAKTTKEEVKAVAADDITPSNFVIVVAGDASKIKADLEKIAPVVMVDPSNPATLPTTAPAK